MKVRMQTLLDYCFSVGFLLQLGISLYLLTSDRYFAATHGADELDFGLRGLEKNGEFVDYDEYRKNCEQSDFLCPYVADLFVGGMTLFAVLISSLLLKVANVASKYVLRRLLAKAIRQTESGLAITMCLRVGVKCAKMVQVATLLDSAVLLSGVVAWTIKSRFADIGAVTTLQAGIGLVLLVLKCILSLTLSAGELLRLLDNWRTNRPFPAAIDPCDKARIMYTTPAYIYSEKVLPGELSLEDTKS